MLVTCVMKNVFNDRLENDQLAVLYKCIPSVGELIISTVTLKWQFFQIFMPWMSRNVGH